MSKDSLAKYYQDNKKSIKKKLVKDIKVFLRKNKKTRNNMVAKDTKIYQKMKPVECRKKYCTMRKNSLL